MPEIAAAQALLAAVGRETPVPSGEGFPPLAASAFEPVYREPELR
jgi:hypothetical protein